MRSAVFFTGRDFATPVPFEPSTIFHACAFTAGREGELFEGAFHACAIAGFDWYKPVFSALFADSGFRAMILRGASFRSARFVGCTFENTLFGRDSLGGACDIDDCSFTDCTFIGCEIDAGDQQPFGRNRWYGCRQHDCRGLEGQF